jgi:hypothetical protein
VFNPAFHSLLVDAHVDERRRAAQSHNRGRNLSRTPPRPLSTRITRAINRVFAGAPAAIDEAVPVLVGQSPAASLIRRS